MNKKDLNPTTAGFIGSASLLIIYFLIVSLTESVNHAIEQFIELWYLIVPLVAGFGIQSGLFYHIRKELKLRRNQSAQASMAASGGVSTTSMIACCAHHLTDVLPIFGLSAATLFLSTYQVFFMVLGVASNLVGITLMLELIKKHKLAKKRSILHGFVGFDLKRARTVVIVVSVFVLFFIAFNVNSNDMQGSISSESFDGGKYSKSVVEQPSLVESFDLSSKVNDLNQVSVEVKPLNVEVSKPVSFKISLNTHSGSLDFDLRDISFLKDDKGNSYKPVSWDGSAPGGHHRSGVLTFSKLKGPAGEIKLTLKEIAGVPERVFEWRIK